MGQEDMTLLSADSGSRERTIPWWADALGQNPDEFGVRLEAGVYAKLRDEALSIALTDDFVPSYVTTAFKIDKTAVVISCLERLLEDMKR